MVLPFEQKSVVHIHLAWCKPHTELRVRIQEQRIFLHPDYAAYQGIQSAPHRQIPVRQFEN